MNFGAKSKINHELSCFFVLTCVFLNNHQLYCLKIYLLNVEFFITLVSSVDE